jgi:hypothetical protein
VARLRGIDSRNVLEAEKTNHARRNKRVCAKISCNESHPLNAMVWSCPFRASCSMENVAGYSDLVRPWQAFLSLMLNMKLHRLKR